MRLTDKELEFLNHELNAAYEGSFVGEDEQIERKNTFESILDKIADEQIRRQGKREALPRKTHPSKWDRFRSGSAMDALMKKINADRSA